LAAAYPASARCREIVAEAASTPGIKPATRPA